MTPAWETRRGIPPAQGPYTQGKLFSTVLVNLEILPGVLEIRVVEVTLVAVATTLAVAITDRSCASVQLARTCVTDYCWQSV